MSRDEAFLKEYQKRFEAKVRENEIAVVDYWKERLDRIIALRPDGVASLQLEMKRLSDMMKNRITSLKKASEE
jgi:hypothetical protein